MVLLKISVDLSDKIYGIHNSLDASMIECMFPKEQAERMNKLPGLKWKLWTIQPDKCSATGLYLFETKIDAEVQASYIVKNYSKIPGLTNVNADYFNIMESLSRITRAPIDLPANPSITGQ